MSFAELFPPSAGGHHIDRFSPEALAMLPYHLELELKEHAFARLLKEGGIHATTSAFVASPKSRAYRTTGKRRATMRGGLLHLHMGKAPGRELVASSELEPPEHLEVYRQAQRLFSLPRHKAAADELNYCIVRGSYTENALILNVKCLSGEIVRSLKAIAEDIAKKVPSVRSAFLYVDESASDYYLEAERPEGKVAFKKLFGPNFLALRLGEKKFLYAPTGFSQINESILPAALAHVEKFSAPQPGDTLLDLYCGYGLWSLALGERFASVWGAELSPEAIRAARGNSDFHHKGRCFHYETGSITEEYLRAKLPPPAGAHEKIILDPPRRGCAPGVLETIISRRPGKILHLFCGADEIVPALRQYSAHGCSIEALVPFDFFPGTLNFELLAVLNPPAGTDKSRRR